MGGPMFQVNLFTKTDGTLDMSGHSWLTVLYYKGYGNSNFVESASKTLTELIFTVVSLYSFTNLADIRIFKMHLQ